MISAATRASRKFGLIAALTAASVFAAPLKAPAQSFVSRPPPPPVAIPAHPSVSPLGWYVLGATACALVAPAIGTLVLNRKLLPQEEWAARLGCFLGPIGWILASQMAPPAVPGAPDGPGTTPTGGQDTHHADIGGNPGGPGGPGNPGASGNPGQLIRNAFKLPSARERGLFVPNEVVLSVDGSVAPDEIEDLARRHHLTRVESHDFTLTGLTLYRWRINDGRTVAAVIRSLAADTRIASAQPNFLFRLQQQAAEDGANADPQPGASEGDPAQYAVGKMHLAEAHKLATGDKVLLALIDSGIDASHPDLEGVVVGKFDAVGGTDKPHPHGTGMAGAIASHHKLMGVAPHVELLAVRAFGAASGSAQGTTFYILKGLDWAAEHGARIINMSFAGPADPALEEALAHAHGKGIVLIAAAGNAGPKSPPLYPAADANVIAVTATDSEDKLFAQANRGDYIAVAAPGVDILVPAPDANYQLTSGTSVAAAEVSGVTALMIQRKPTLTPDEARSILMQTARKLGAKGQYGAGLVDALEAASQAGSGAQSAR